MAKSLRAKAKMANRRKKREGGNYHAADAARVARISAKLLGKEKKVDGEGEEDDEEMVEDEEDAKDGEDADMGEHSFPFCTPSRSNHLLDMRLSLVWR